LEKLFFTFSKMHYSKIFNDKYWKKEKNCIF